MTAPPSLKVGVLVVSAFLAVGAAVGSVWAAQRGGAGLPDPERMQQAIDAADMIRVADIPGDESELAHGVFVQELRTGYLCVWDARSAASRERQGGCNSIDDPLGGNVLSASLAYDGGPAIENVREARLAGLADANVASIVLLMSDGSERAVRMREAHLRSGDFRAFGFRFKRSDLRRGVGPIAVVAFDESGNEIGRQETGIG